VHEDDDDVVPPSDAPPEDTPDTLGCSHPENNVSVIAPMIKVKILFSLFAFFIIFS
jgi:hypothetical protein